jgi:type VII secretion protein EccB
MASRRDQIQSYQFLTRRVVAALVTRETDPDQSPLRRGIGAVFAGAMVAVVAAAGFGIYGLLTKSGSGNWKVDGAVVVERDTGASYVYQSGVLYPALNYTSALLAAGHNPPVVERVPAASLTGVARGNRVGIAGAPASLPATADALRGSWSVCATATGTVLSVGRAEGDTPLGDRGVLVGQGGTTYLVWHGMRYHVSDPAVVVASLFGAGTATRQVGAAWLSALPEASAIGPLTVTGRGTPSTVLSGHSVGDVLYADTGSGRQYYLLLADGLAALTETQRDIVQGQYPVTPTPVALSTANQAPRSRQLGPAADPGTAAPAVPPKLVDAGDGAALCARTAPGQPDPQLSTGGTVPAGLPVSGKGATALVDRVAVPAGHFAVVRALASPTATDGPYSLVTDDGTRYPLPGADTLGVLGYSTALAVTMPAAVVDRLPVGPLLDPTTAGRPAA